MNAQERRLNRFTRVIARNVLSSSELARLRDEKIGTLTTFDRLRYKIVDVWRDDLNRAIACCELAKGE